MSVYRKLATLLATNHVFVNECWQTRYGQIPGLKLQASSSNGRSGLGTYQGHKVYWYSSDGKEWLVEPA